MNKETENNTDLTEGRGQPNREAILRQKEVAAKADLAELASQGKTIGGGFAEGAVARQKVLQEESDFSYDGAFGHKKSTNLGIIILLVIFGAVILYNLFSRLSG